MARFTVVIADIAVPVKNSPDIKLSTILLENGWTSAAAALVASAQEMMVWV